MKRSRFGLLTKSPSTHAGTKSLRVMRNCQKGSRFGQTRVRALGPLLIAVTLIFTASIPTANAQNPRQYQLTWLGDGRPRDINEAGLVAFGWSSYIYDHATGIKVDLNDASYGADWIDLDELQADQSSQWKVQHSNGINENNEIIGTARHVDGVTADRNFVLYDPLGPAPRFELVPRAVLDGSKYNVCLNDNGEVAEGREINNSGVVVGGTSPGTIEFPNGTFESFEGHYFTGINDSGMITGYRVGIYSGPRGDRRDGGPILFDVLSEGPGDNDLIMPGSATNGHGDVNNLNQVAFSTNGRGYIDLPGLGVSNLDDLIANDPSSQAYMDWINSTIFPSGINDAGQIIGQAQVNGEWNGFILTPIVPSPTISVTDQSLDEGNAGTTTPGQFTVTLSELTGQDVMVPYEIVDGTATFGDDYTTSASSGLLTFAFSAGETSKTVEFTIVGDDTNEPDETFLIQLGEAIGGAVVTKSEGTATIKNDEISNVTMSVDDPSIQEGNNGDQTPDQFTITLSAAAADDVQVWYQVSNGSARKNKDYAMVDSASGLLTFTAGDTSQTVSFVVLGDNRRESDETFMIELTDAFGATISKGVGTATIVDND